MRNKQHDGASKAEGRCNEEGFSPIEDCDGYYDGGGAIVGDGGSNGKSFLRGNPEGRNSGPWVMGYCASNGVSR